MIYNSKRLFTNTHNKNATGISETHKGTNREVKIFFVCFCCTKIETQGPALLPLLSREWIINPSFPNIASHRFSIFLSSSFPLSSSFSLPPFPSPLLSFSPHLFLYSFSPHPFFLSLILIFFTPSPLSIPSLTLSPFSSLSLDSPPLSLHSFFPFPSFPFASAFIHSSFSLLSLLSLTLLPIPSSPLLP